MKNEFRIIHFLIFIFSEARKMKNEFSVWLISLLTSSNSVWFIFQISFFLEKWKMKNELSFCLIFFSFLWKKLENEK